MSWKRSRLKQQTARCADVPTVGEDPAKAAQNQEDLVQDNLC